jgi:hypothetical protein
MMKIMTNMVGHRIGDHNPISICLGLWKYAHYSLYDEKNDRSQGFILVRSKKSEKIK